ncbi:TetR/AcrR family transcriptional regulator [Micromonospora sp. WP24]|nr:TetR/AcrR family transcriptional regulator [Micromonospora sp. WP24]
MRSVAVTTLGGVSGPDDGGDALIVETASRLAEIEGWAAVTPRRVAERAGVDVGDLYRRFPDPDSIIAAVALRGFADLTTRLTEARQAVADPCRAWAAVVSAYLDFAYANPEVYDAMLAHTPDLTLGAAAVPAAPRAAFAELRAALAPLTAGRDQDTLAEVGWSVLHGLVMLTRGGRLRPGTQEERETLIAQRLFVRP